MVGPGQLTPVSTPTWTTLRPCLYVALSQSFRELEVSHFRHFRSTVIDLLNQIAPARSKKGKTNPSQSKGPFFVSMASISGLSTPARQNWGEEAEEYDDGVKATDGVRFLPRDQAHRSRVGPSRTNSPQRAPLSWKDGGLTNPGCHCCQFSPTNNCQGAPDGGLIMRIRDGTKIIFGFRFCSVDPTTREKLWKCSTSSMSQDSKYYPRVLGSKHEQRSTTWTSHSFIGLCEKLLPR